MKLIKLLLILVATTFTYNSAISAEIDWAKVNKLQGKALLSYVETLELKNQDALNFWKNVPVSKANSQVNKIFRDEAFAIYMNKYPRVRGRGAQFTAGSGINVVGPISKQNLRLPFVDIHPLPEGPVGDLEKHYNIAYTIHGLSHPWLLNNADTAQWEADRHSNVTLSVLDPEFDNDKQAKQIDALIKEKVDGILIWPMQEAPTGPPVDRALAAGIPVVSVDRLVGSRKIDAQVTGNFPANGTQQALYLIHRLLKETGKVKGTILMIRKPLGSTADSMRTGHFLKVISYFPDLTILQSYHNSSSRADSLNQVSEALGKYPNVDVIFCTGAEQGMGAVLAVDQAGRWDSRKDGRRIMVLSNDDLFEALQSMEEGKIAVTAPYTPLLGGLGIRVLLKILAGEKIPKNVATPDLPMITIDGEEIFGIKTISVKEWIPYTYGRM
ncbi:MAG: sugar ABC transporter substrate-binding protein [Rhodospirillales bacterium]|jgi:ribose transport system substrate-binding protein|nr:sugar ABC transporter substrate-binding protein [Rhodospirillales bacterium]